MNYLQSVKIKQSGQFCRLMFYIPILLSFFLGGVNFLLIYQLRAFSNKITTYYNPVIFASSTMEDAAVVLHNSRGINESINSNISSNYALTNFIHSYEKLSSLVGQGEFADRHKQLVKNNDFVLKGQLLLSKIKMDNFDEIKNNLHDFILLVRNHTEIHKNELRKTQNKILTTSFFAAPLSIGILFSGTTVSLVVRRNQETLKRKQQVMAAMTALISALEARDPYTKGHSLRVANLSAKIASNLRVSENESQQVYLSGLLHDIGKLGIPDRYLSKKESLTKDEYISLQQHPAIGKKILENSKMLNEIIPGIYHHHEKYDGSGYPDGLRGETIPLAAQCIAIADTFDAMTSSRPYRKALPLMDALDEIDRYRGQYWSESIVKSFLEVIGNGA